MSSTSQCDLNIDLNCNQSRSLTKISAKSLASQPPKSSQNPRLNTEKKHKNPRNKTNGISCKCHESLVTSCKLTQNPHKHQPLMVYSKSTQAETRHIPRLPKLYKIDIPHSAPNHNPLPTDLTSAPKPNSMRFSTNSSCIFG